MALRAARVCVVAIEHEARKLRSREFFHNTDEDVVGHIEPQSAFQAQKYRVSPAVIEVKADYVLLLQQNLDLAENFARTMCASIDQ
jgi:hypothetical protein